MGAEGMRGDGPSADRKLQWDGSQMPGSGSPVRPRVSLDQSKLNAAFVFLESICFLFAM
jgi:hypothetical protein